MRPQAQTSPAPTTPVAPAEPQVQVTAPNILLRKSDGGTTIIQTSPAPLTARDVAVLKARRSELSDQLQSVDGRRSKLLNQLQATGDETAKKGLEDRISLLDKRQLQLEGDLAETGRQLSSAPATLVATTGIADNGNVFRSVRSATGPILGGLFIIFVLAPLALRFARGNFRRMGRGAGSVALSADAEQRLARIEQSIDAIAVEVERVSEGQRFVTKLLSESQHLPALGGERVQAPVRANQ